MSFNKGMLMTLFLLSTSKVSASSIDFPITQFSIKPISCVVSKLGDVCQLNATVEWTSAKNVDLCLLQDETQLYCWPNGNKGKKVLPVSLTATSHFKLTHSSNIVASQQVAIASIQPKVKRRRLRSGWSIF